MEIEMATKTVRDIVERFVGELDELIEGQVNERLQARMKTIAESFGSKPMAVKNTKKKARKSVQRPCPVAKCKETAHPRFHQLCRKHDGELSIAEGDALRMKAERPGGKWYKLGIGKYAAADARKKAKKVKASSVVSVRKPAQKAAAGGSEEEF